MPCKVQFVCSVCKIPVKGRGIRRHLRIQHKIETRPSALAGAKKRAKALRQKRSYTWVVKSVTVGHAFMLAV